MRTLHVVLPNDIDDPRTPSGGNVYDRRLLRGLSARGWTVVELAVPGSWPAPSQDERAFLARTLAALPDDALVLVDGLVGSAAPDELVPAAKRLRLVPLVHMPLGDDAEAKVLTAARAVVTTSPWTRDLLDVPPPVTVATPGVDPAPLAPGSPAGSRLLCVAAVSPHKGHDLLTDALTSVGQPYECAYVGSLTREPEFVAALRDRAPGTIRFAGPLVGADLDAAYARADLLVLASRGETYGMVVTEALARGVPVLATAVGGLPDALGEAPDGSVPGLLVPPEDPGALAAALRRWLTDADLRARLRRSAVARRETLTGWDVTAGIVADVLTGIPAVPAGFPGDA
ncbi:MAG TPA: glycosyltransferase family 4 protein [Mycobacteriales bacterium]|nr:glycosyltransferase family 4 protein [Mycobacteriales bacterium]